MTPERWGDLEALFGARGACTGCWCMSWRQTRAEHERNKGEKNRRAMQAIVTGGEVPGLLAYVDGTPPGWCAIGPRKRYPSLDRSRILQRVDDQPVWSVTCFFISRHYRGRGLSERLLLAAVEHAREFGATVVEGYPVEPRTANMPGVFAWTGIATTFRKAGFIEVARRSPTRPIMRRVLTL